MEKEKQERGRGGGREETGQKKTEAATNCHLPLPHFTGIQRQIYRKVRSTSSSTGCSGQSLSNANGEGKKICALTDSDSPGADLQCCG